MGNGHTALIGWTATALWSPGSPEQNPILAATQKVSFVDCHILGEPLVAETFPTMHVLRPMTLADYDSVIELMKQTRGVAFRDADSRESTARYLERNPELSFVATVGQRLAGCVMSGHDGRRGYLQHLVVLPQHRHKGIANALVESCLSELERLGIRKCHIDVFKANALGSAYWESQGWKLRTDIHRYSFVRSGGENA